MKLKSFLTFFALVMFFFFAKISFAGFDVVTKKNPAPCDRSTKGAEDYGNASTKEFREAMTGEGEISAYELEKLNEEIPDVDTNVWYGKVKASLPKRRMSSIKNTSVGNYANLALGKNTCETHDKSIEVAVGYIWNEIRSEVEYVYFKNFQYKPENLFNTGVAGFEGNLKTDVFFYNWFYEFLHHDLFKPYVAGGVGIGLNKASAKLASDKTSKKVQLAWNLGFGIKMKIMKRLYADASYRYLDLGKFNFTDGNLVRLKGRTSSIGLSFGLVFHVY